MVYLNLFLVVVCEMEAGVAGEEELSLAWPGKVAVRSQAVARGCHMLLTPGRHVWPEPCWHGSCLASLA